MSKSQFTLVPIVKIWFSLYGQETEMENQGGGQNKESHNEVLYMQKAAW